MALDIVTLLGSIGGVLLMWYTAIEHARQREWLYAFGWAVLGLLMLFASVGLYGLASGDLASPMGGFFMDLGVVLRARTGLDRKSTRLNSSTRSSRMPSSA